MKLAALAKVNLTLEVFATRADGYHALRSLVLPVSLADEITVEPATALSSDTGYPNDLCLKAARVLDAHRGARIGVVKRIPAGGGLGGGSADAAATLIALNRVWQLGHSRKRLIELAANVGSDVPALVCGGPVVMEGRGECVTPLSFDIPRLSLVLVNPRVSSSTAEVYSMCAARDASAPNATARMLDALHAGNLTAIAAALQNDLQACAVRLHPEIATALDALRAVGARGVLMSGSGSTVFGLFSSDDESRAVAAQLAAAGWLAWAVTPVAERTAARD